MKIFVTAFLLAFSGLTAAQTTRTWEQSKYDEFVKGTSKGVAIRSNGTLELAPEFKALATTPSTYIWSAASNKDGDLFAASGAPARLYRVTPEGKVTVVLSPSELQVQAVVCAPDGTIYAATSPDGKVYKIQRGTPAKPPTAAQSGSKPEPKGAQRQESKASEPKIEIKAEPDTGYVSSVFFEPKTKYIWALALDTEGRLYVATGDKGEIYRVDKDGKGSVFFASDETHIRSLAFDQAGNLIAGSDGSGLIYRISPRGEGFVLYSAAKKEITALSVDSVGVIYAAGAGEKRAATPSSPMALAPAIPSPAPISGTTSPNIALAPGLVPNVPVPGLGATGSEIYRIDTDGTPHRLWSSREDLVYSLAIDNGGRLLAGTGNKGKIVAVYNNGNYTDLLKASANQVVGFAPAPGGALYAATSNLGKVLLIRDSTQREATFDSDVFDAKMISRWGRVELATKGNVELFTRAGNVDNPDRNWSPWLKVDPKELSIASPPARFLQWRAVLRSGNPGPVVESVRVNYLPRNIAPEIEDVNVSVGNKFSSTPRTTMEALSSVGRESGLLSIPRSESAPAPTKDHGSVAVRWTARDDNDDQLTYSIYYRGENEKRWLPLKTGLADKFYSFDSNLMPDGTYTIKVVASDAPSHSPGEALTASRESTTFDVDNTPPQITNLIARSVGDTIRISFTAADAASVLRRAEFSVDAGDWQFVAPKGGISDSKTETYEFATPLPKVDDQNQTSGEGHVVVVRVFDRADNMGMAKTLAVSAAK